jgi:hypothetical protein
MGAVEVREDVAVALRMEPGESLAAFAARVAQAHGPLTQTEVAKLRKVFAPAGLKQTTAAVPALTRTAA